MVGEATREVTRNDIRYNRVENELNRVKDGLEPTTKNDLEVDWESYKDIDGNSLDDLILEVLQNNFDCGNTYGYKVADEIIDLLPSVTPQEPKTGHWIIDGHHRRCSECGEYFCIKDAEGNEIPSSFCPNCGADMREMKET